MKNIKLILVFMCGVFFACNNKPSVKWIVSTQEYSWKAQGVDSIEFFSNNNFDATVDIENPKQTVEGFGT
jgi:hypothetical protein